MYGRNTLIQLAKRQSYSLRCYNRVTSLLRVTPSNSSHEKSEQNGKSRWLKRSLLFSCGIGTAVICYLIKETLPYNFPRVSAATIPMTGRFQFSFLADVAETALKSLVFIEIKNKDKRAPDTVSNGSGFIVESDGLILTNAHVVVNKPRSIVSVRLSDGRNFTGIVEAVDPISDLATVRIKCKDLPALKLGASANLMSGQFVVALGSPLALGNSITAGLISTTQRHSEELGLLGRDINYIPTDASINFGNSGGPLVNLFGEAIGVNSMQIIPGISLAIPIDYVKNFLKLAEEKKKKGCGSALPAPVKRYMGITMLTLTPSILAELKQRGSQIPDSIQSGIFVWKVIFGSPAQNAGLTAGDVVVQINGKDVKESSDVYEIPTNCKNALNMTVLRNGQRVKISVVPDELE